MEHSELKNVRDPCLYQSLQIQFQNALIFPGKLLLNFHLLNLKKLSYDILQDRHNDITKLIHYDSYVHIYSQPKDNLKGEAELRGTNPKRLEN